MLIEFGGRCRKNGEDVDTEYFMKVSQKNR